MKDRPLYYGMDGKPLDQEGFIDLFTGSGDKKRRVAFTALPNGFNVSTVLLGIDHNFSPCGPPIIFESMVFDRASGFGDLDCERYSTKAEAEAGHAAMVKKWEKKRRATKILEIDLDIPYAPKGDGPDDA